jgi:hypothetical protein
MIDDFRLFGGGRGTQADGERGTCEQGDGELTTSEHAILLDRVR